MGLEIKDLSGSDISVTTFSRATFADLGWPDPVITAMMPDPEKDRRRVALIPLTIEVSQPIELPAGETTVLAGTPFIFPVVKNGFDLTVFDWLSGEPIKEVTVAVPLLSFLDLQEPTKIKLSPGQPAIAWGRHCLLDITGIPNNNRRLPDGSFRQELYGLYITCKIPGLFLSLSVPIRIGSYQVRHGASVDIL